MSCSNCPAKAILNKPTEPDLSSVDPCGKLDTYDWLNNLPESRENILVTEIRFKNTRKEFFVNKGNLPIKRGDYVAVSAQNGHDVGQITLTGKLAQMQMQRKKVKDSPERIIYRKATPADIEKLNQSRLQEKPAMIRARQVAVELSLEMKISDVEFQADGTKATFYYIAEGRIDFRELIKVYAKEFKVRIEMRQIGARQEAAMIGGIGSCGNELCCSSWRSNLESVSAMASKIQELPQNIQKLTGQCGKLKCCLMYELDSYIEAQSDFPDVLLELEMESGMAYPRKKDVLQKVIWYSHAKSPDSALYPLPLSKVKDYIMLNKKGIKAPAFVKEPVEKDLEYTSFENDLDTFKVKKKKNRPKRNNRN